MQINKILIFYLAAVLLGLVTGIVSSCFQLAIRQVSHFSGLCMHYLANQNLLVLVIISVLFSMLLTIGAWLIAYIFARDAYGSGIPEIESALLGKRAINWRRLLPVKFIGGVMAISAQMVVGREGPTIQMGGNLGKMAGELLGFRIRRQNILVAAGSAAGLAAAFNAPMAGVLFVIEEMRRHFHYNFTNFKSVAICCVAAVITSDYLIGSAAAIPMPIFTLPGLDSFWLFLFLGIAAGLLALLFNKLLMKSLYWTDKLNLRGRIIYLAIVGALVGIGAVFFPNLVGGGYGIIEQSLSFSPGFVTLIVLLIVRLLITLICYSTGVPGGVFAPLLALGTLVGLAFFQLANHLIGNIDVHPGVCAILGMGAVFAAAVRAPLTSIMLVVEMTQNYSLILPLMVTCLTATLVVQIAKNDPLYMQLARRALRNHQIKIVIEKNV